MILDKAASIIKKDFLTALRYRNGLMLNAFAPVAQLVMSYYLARSVRSAVSGPKACLTFYFCSWAPHSIASC